MMPEKLRELAKSPLGNPTRLAIALYLLPKERVSFGEIAKALKLTPGNLDFHLRELEKNGIVKIYKGFADRPRTFVELTERGVTELEWVMKTLREVIGND